MPTYYGRFKHVCGINENSENTLGDLMGFFNINPSGGDIKQQIIKQFEKVFERKYGRTYVLGDFGIVKVGKGYLVKEEVYSKGDLERLAEKAFE